VYCNKRLKSISAQDYFNQLIQIYLWGIYSQFIVNTTWCDGWRIATFN